LEFLGRVLVVVEHIGVVHHVFIVIEGTHIVKVVMVIDRSLLSRTADGRIAATQGGLGVRGGGL